MYLCCNRQEATVFNSPMVFEVMRGDVVLRGQRGPAVGGLMLAPTLYPDGAASHTRPASASAAAPGTQVVQLG